MKVEKEEEHIPSSAVTKHAYRIGLSGTETKAGLAGVNKAKVNEVIYEVRNLVPDKREHLIRVKMSKGSRFFKNEQRKEVEMQRRIEHMKKRMASGLKDDPSIVTKVEKLVEQLEAERDMSQTMLHVDMDAFYGTITAKCL